MSRRRQRTHRRIVDKWESSGDPQLTRILKELEQRADELTGGNRVQRFVALVLAREAMPELKLKLIRHIIDWDILRILATVDSERDKGDQRLERAYRTVFKEWWNKQEEAFRTMHPRSRIRALANYRIQLPKKLGFSRQLQKDFDLAARALMQELKTEQELKPTTAAEPTDRVRSAKDSPAQTDPPLERIPWIGAKNELIELFNVLIRQKKIPAVPKAEKYRYIEQHFVDENLESFTTKNLAELERITNATRTGRPKGIHALEGEIVRSFELMSSVETPED